MEQLEEFKNPDFQKLDLKTKKTLSDKYFDDIYGGFKEYSSQSDENKQKIKDAFAGKQIDFRVADTLDIAQNFRDKQVEKRVAEQNKPLEVVEKPAKISPEKPIQSTAEDELYNKLNVYRLANPIAPNADGTMPPPLINQDPLHALPTTQEEAIQKADEIKKQSKYEKINQHLSAQDLPLEDATLDLAFAGGGLVRAGQGVVAKTLAKTTAEKLAAEKMIAGGQAFAKGDIVGNAAAQGAMGVADEMITDDFKKSHPMTSGLIEMGAGLIFGGYAGIKAENKVMQKYANLEANVKSGKVNIDDAEKILSEDDSFVKQFNDAKDKQVKQKVEDGAYNARTPDEVVKDTQIADEFLKATKPKKVSEELAADTSTSISSHVDENGLVVLAQQDPIVDGFESLKKNIVGDGEKLVPYGYVEPTVAPETPKKEMALEYQIQEKEVLAKNSLRIAEQKKAINSPDEATSLETQAQSYLDEAQKFREQLASTQIPEPIIEKPRVGEPEAKQTTDNLLKRPRINELLDMRKDVLAKDIQSPNKLVQKGGSRELNSNSGTDKIAYDKAQYTKNYTSDFELTKLDVAKIKAGRIDEKVAGKLERDLGVMDNHPDYAPQKMSDDDWNEANSLFSKGIDNVVVATYAGVEQDENGNLSFDPTKFVLGLGGYTAVKAALKNKSVQGKLKEYAQNAINKIDMNPAVYKENGLNAMVTGGKDGKSFIMENGEQSNKILAEFNLSDTVKSLTGIDANKAEADLTRLYEKHPEIFKDEKEVFKIVRDVLTDASHFVQGSGKENALILAKIDGKLGKVGLKRDSIPALVVHALKASKVDSELRRLIKKQMEGSPTPSFPTSETAAHGAKAHSSTYNESIPQDAEKLNIDKEANLKEWHKDSSPLTKNEDGSPKVFYHGTMSDFNEFKNTGIKANGSRAGEGFYFTADVRKANNYAKYGKNGNVMPVYLNAKNIYRGIEQLTPAQKDIYLHTEKPTNEILKELGFDARAMDDKEIVVFEPTQIKSIHNQGTFDATDANILHANARHTLAGGFAGGADSELNQRDYNGDGVHDFKDLLYGAGAGAVGINALKKVRPTWFDDGFVHGEKSVKVGMFAGDGVTVKNTVQKAFNKGELKGTDTLPDETFLQLSQRKMQDKFNRVRQLINHKASMETIDDVMNPYQKEELMHSKVQAKLSDLETQTVTPIIEKIAKTKLTTEQVDEYLWARHAPERNKKMYELHTKPTSISLEEADTTLLKYQDSGIKEAIKEAKKNENSFFGKFTQKNVDEYQEALSQKKLHEANAKINKNGSGMSNEDAYRIINKFKDNKEMNEIAQDIYTMNRDRLKLIRDEGLESDEFVKVLEGLYDNYVPLRREFGTEDKAAYVGKGFDTKGKETKKAKGSNRAVESPLMHSILAYEETILRAGKNEVGKSFLNFAEEFPDDALYTISDLKHKAIYDKNGAVVGVDSLYKKDDNVLHVKIDGKIKEITIHDPALASAFKNLNSVQMSGILRASHKAIRLIATLNTSYNPEFVVSNFERDIQTAMINMPASVKKNRLNIVKDVLPAMKGIYTHSVKGEDNAWGTLFNELKHEGGTTGWNDLHSVQDIKKSTQVIVNKYNGKVIPKEAARKVFNYIDNVNDAVENATRLVSYKMAKESGLSNAKAASIAKNLTVNFNRSGEIGSVANSLFMFYNASIQGTTRMMAQLKDSRKAQVIVTGIALSAIGMDFHNRSVNADAYELIPDYIKDTNFILMNEDGTYETMQLPYGYNMFKAVGDIAAKAYHKEIELKDIPTRLLSMSVNAFSPIGVDADSAVHTVLPTLIKPFYEVETNKNFFGGNIAPEDNPFSPETPDSQKYFKSVSPVAKTVAQKLNEYTGGNMVKSGGIDVSPETIEHLVGFATGGVGRFIMNAETTGEQYLSNEKVDKNKIPFARKFYHVPREKEETNLVYQLSKKSAIDLLSPLERQRFYKWAAVAYDKKDLTDEQYKKLKKTFKDNQGLQDFAKKHNLQTNQDFTEEVKQDSYSHLTKAQVLRILRAKEKEDK